MTRSIVLCLIFFSTVLYAQETTFKTNGPDDYREGVHALTHATIFKDHNTKISDASIVIRNGKIVSVGENIAIPTDAIVHDMSGKFIYPSFVDIFSDYGMPAIPEVKRPDAQQLDSSIKGAFAWNQAIRSDFHAVNAFNVNEKNANELRASGFGAVLTHRRDGIFRGTGALVTLSNERENLVVLKAKASSHLSFDKGTSTQSYPGSKLGSIALIRQTFYDAQWYAANKKPPELNLSLQEINEARNLVTIFDASGQVTVPPDPEQRIPVFQQAWPDMLRAAKIAKEFRKTFIIRGQGDEYQRIEEIKHINMPVIASLNFPLPFDVEEPLFERLLPLKAMLHWELAPSNPSYLEKAGVPFAFSVFDLPNKEAFLPNLRKAVARGLSESEALKALTYTPATLIGAYDQIGSLAPGKLANFIITTAPIFADKTTISENWILGKRFDLPLKVEKEKPATTAAPTTNESLGSVVYPFGPYGNVFAPGQKTYLLKNATLWTNEDEGVLAATDLVIRGGKIYRIGKELLCSDCEVIDATGKFVTSGIIDEHSHIAANAVNEWGKTSSAEVRMGDVLNSEDMNIYRQLAGGVTASQILHGSANAIGGQNAIIKLRWGYAPEQLSVEGADPTIKFALGENVKQSNWPGSVSRYPQTRMGVEQTYVNFFTKAKEYKEKWRHPKGEIPRRDLELDALSEILEHKRFVTCHSYVQSEVNMLMHVAKRFGFRVNTFTHILDGYKVADKIKDHGASASTFSDWWGYKMEVSDAIPYNASLLTRMGINTAINSDDAEMGRRLNQEAAKSIKFGGLSEQEAWKLVTLNPTKMLHLDKRMGSLKVGKDADVVVWSDNPLSVYAQVEKTFVDGILFFDQADAARKSDWIRSERSRLIAKMMEEKKSGRPTQGVRN